MTPIFFVVSALFDCYIHLKFVLYQLVALQSSHPISQHWVRSLRPEGEGSDLKEGKETDSFYTQASEG